MDRNIVDVINQIRAEIPGGYLNLELGLEKFINDLRYKAPEQMPEMLGRLGFLLQKYLGNPDTEWKEKIYKIMSGKP